MSQEEEGNFALLLSNELILLPTPLSAHIPGYRDIFRKLHANPLYCQTAFGDHFKPRNWNDEECFDVLQRDVMQRWGVRGMGDFAVGRLLSSDSLGEGSGKGFEGLGRRLKRSMEDIRIVQDPNDLDNLSKIYDNIHWIGYVCVRDAIPGLPPPPSPTTPAQEPFPPWQEMIEVRYGLDPSARGVGIITRAQRAVMEWAVEERGVRRFVAETMVGNEGSARVLERLGFVRSGTGYFGMEDAVEWCQVVGG